MTYLLVIIRSYVDYHLNVRVDRFMTSTTLNCKRGGFVIIRHNNIRDFEASLLRRVCKDVKMEPQLQPLNGEQINGLIGDEARAISELVEYGVTVKTLILTFELQVRTHILKII